MLQSAAAIISNMCHRRGAGNFFNLTENQMCHNMTQIPYLGVKICTVAMKVLK